MKTVPQHTRVDLATKVTHNKRPTPVAQPSQSQPRSPATRRFTTAGRGGCTSCGK